MTDQGSNINVGINVVSYSGASLGRVEFTNGGNDYVITAAFTTFPSSSMALLMSENGLSYAGITAILKWE